MAEVNGRWLLQGMTTLVTGGSKGISFTVLLLDDFEPRLAQSIAIKVPKKVDIDRGPIDDASDSVKRGFGNNMMVSVTV
ncbi:hypothetical protein VNO78_32963 [Psophocarpus tetragonolobus]|uniref:Uncharacterized protein n=1 Tax=Psophocarpus tetragonolobus TaxID=3891 RepID=A0AAN9P0A0_PSOTE